MSLLLLPKECQYNIFLFLDKSSEYNCLFVNRYLCGLIVPIIWRDPLCRPRSLLIKTLFTFRNKDEEVQFFQSNFHEMKFNHPITPLFEYGKFIKIINHGYLRITVRRRSFIKD